jgi:hypothetical protein
LTYGYRLMPWWCRSSHPTGLGFAREQPLEQASSTSRVGAGGLWCPQPPDTSAASLKPSSLGFEMPWLCGSDDAVKGWLGLLCVWRRVTYPG